MSWREFENFLDASRDWICNHLEISQLHSSGRWLSRRILFCRADQQLSTGRHGHEDDSYREEHDEHDRVERNFGWPRAEHVPGTSQDSEGRGRSAELHAMRLAADRR